MLLVFVYCRLQKMLLNVRNKSLLPTKTLFTKIAVKVDSLLQLTKGSSTFELLFCDSIHRCGIVLFIVEGCVMNLFVRFQA